jgi:hypothetical protein
VSLDDWRTLTLGSAAVGQTVFVLLYATFPWWRFFFGRALFYKAMILATILDLFLVARVWDVLRNDVFFVVLYGLLAIGIWWQTAAFMVVKARGRAGQVSGNHQDIR